MNAQQRRAFLRKIQPRTTAEIDALVAHHTAFATMDAMLNAKGGYFPSLYVFHREVKAIADEYDRLQTLRGDPRRAFRHT